MSNENVGVAITDNAEELLMPMLDKMRTKAWANERKKPICLICEAADFSGPLVELLVLAKDKDASLKIWIPHSFVLVAFDFSQSRKIGFQ